MKVRNPVRIVASIIVTGLLYVAVTLYNAMMPSIEARIALGQVKDSVIEYSLAQAFMSSHMGKPLMFALYFLILLAIWWKLLAAATKGSSPTSQS